MPHRQLRACAQIAARFDSTVQREFTRMRSISVLFLVSTSDQVFPFNRVGIAPR